MTFGVVEATMTVHWESAPLGRSILHDGILRWGLPAGLLCGALVAWTTGRELLPTLAVSVPSFAAVGVLIGLGQHRRSPGAGRDESPEA